MVERTVNAVNEEQLKKTEVKGYFYQPTYPKNQKILYKRLLMPLYNQCGSG